jgi:hypothetical protein
MRIFSDRLLLLWLTGTTIATVALGVAVAAGGSDLVGRWKVNGTQCYWDATDTGPDQCNPNAGRWKLNGTTCYWDGFDSGPDQCNPNAGRWKWSGSACYWDGFDTGPAQCDPNHPPQPPTVNVTAPSSGATFAAAATIVLSASASDPSGTITRVEFYSGPTLLATDTTTPYSYTWSGVTAGSYSVRTKAVDSWGLSAWSPSISVVVTPPNVPPTVSMTSPAGGSTATAPATITLSANAADADGSITTVAFYAGATLLATDTVAPYSYTWASAPAGSYTFTARATDNAGAMSTSTGVTLTVNAANVPPAVSIAQPTSGAGFTAPATIDVMATATDTDGSVTKVDFYVGATLLASDSVAPYSFAWNGVGVGSYTITAVATDDAGATTTSGGVSVAVAATNAPPVVNLLEPASGAEFTAPATIGLSVGAIDSDGSITRVDFYAGANLLATDTTAPYGYAWVGVSAGSYTLTAKATDNGGATTTSAAAIVTVAAPNSPPTVSVTAPSNGASYVAPAAVQVAASATDSDGVVDRVEFFADGELIASDTTAPYTAQWTILSTGAGVHSLTTSAVDNSGAVTMSATVSVTVTPPTGRYKLDGGGNCYWEPADSGPAQCEPVGPPFLVVNGSQASAPVVAPLDAELLAQFGYGPGETGDWVGLFAQGAADSRTAAIDWQYLNGQPTPPTSALVMGSVRFAGPSVPGQYEVRLYSASGVRVATGASISTWSLQTILSCWTTTSCIHNKIFTRDGVLYESESCEEYVTCVDVPGGGGDDGGDDGGGRGGDGGGDGGGGSGGGDPESPDPPTVQITKAEIRDNEVVVLLSPVSASGLLTVTATLNAANGASSDFTLLSTIVAGGEHSINFQDSALPVGQYTRVFAEWTTLGGNAAASEDVSFLVYGYHRHTQYNSPLESLCPGAEITVRVDDYEHGCALVVAQGYVRSGFWNFADSGHSSLGMNGSGWSTYYGLVKAKGATVCSGPITQVAKPYTAFMTEATTSTIAWSRAFQKDFQRHDEVLVVGPGKRAIGVIDDLCPDCRKFDTFDHYSSSLECDRNLVGDFAPFAQTIRLR